MPTALNVTSSADLTAVLKAYQAFTEKANTLILAQKQVVGEVDKVTHSIDAKGNAISKLSVTLAEGIKQTYAFKNGQELLGRQIKDTTAALQRQRAAIPPQSVQARISAFSIGGSIPVNTQDKTLAGFSKIQPATGFAVEKQIKDVTTLTKATNEATKATQSYLISWQSFTRLLTIQLMHQAISQLSQALKKGTADAMEFQIRISEIRTISQDAALSAGEWAKGIKEVSDSFGFDILDTAEATYQAISNQVVKGAEAFKFMADSSRLAITTVSTLTQASNSLASVINAYGLKASDATEISAKLFTAVNLGRFRLEEAADSLGNITVIAREAGVSFDELLAGMVAMTIQGFTWSQSMTQMRGLISQLIKPSTDMAKFLKSIGAESGEAAVKTYGLIGVVDLLKSKTDGSSTAIAEEVRNIRGLLAALSLSGQGHEAYVKALDRVRNSTTEYTRATEIAMESNAKKIQIETNKVRNYFLNDLGNSVLEGIAKITGAMGGFEATIKRTIDILQIIFTTGIVVAIANITKLGTAVELLTVKFAALGTATRVAIPGALIGEALVQGILYAYEQWNEQELESFKLFEDNINKRKALFDEFNRNLAQGVIDPLKNAGSTIALSLAQMLVPLNTEVTNVTENSKVIAKIIDETIATIIQGTRTELNEVQGLLKDAESQVKNIQKFYKDVDKTARQMKEDFAVGDITDQPAKQIDVLQRSLRGLATELQSATSLDEVKRVQDQIFDNIKSQEGIQRKVVKENLTSTEKRRDLERNIALENFRYGERSRDLDERIRKLRFKSGFDAAVHDREALQTQHKEKIDNYNKELEAVKTTEFKKRDYINQTETARLAIIRRTQEIERGFTKPEEAGGIIASLQKTQLTLKERLKLLENLKQELTRLDFSTIIAKDDPDTIKKWFKDRVAIITQAIDIMQKELPRLPDLEKEKIQKIIDQFAAERAAIIIKTEQIEPLKKQGKNVADELTRVENLVKFVTDDLGKITSGISLLQGRITEGIDKTIKGQFVEEVRGRVGSAQERAADIAFLQSLKTGFLAKPELLLKLPEALQQGIAQRAGLSPKSFELLIELMKRQADTGNEVAKLQKQTEELQREFGKLTKSTDAGATAVTTFADKVGTANTAITHLGRNMQALADMLIITLARLPKPTEPIAPTVPGPQFKASGGMMMGSDSVPAMLSPGEFVMNSASTRRFYSQLVAMNSVGRYAEGGQVSNVNVGDIHVGLNSSGNESVDVIKLGRLLQREIKRGTISLS